MPISLKSFAPVAYLVAATATIQLPRAKEMPEPTLNLFTTQAGVVALYNCDAGGQVIKSGKDKAVTNQHGEERVLYDKFESSFVCQDFDLYEQLRKTYHNTKSALLWVDHEAKKGIYIAPAFWQIYQDTKMRENRKISLSMSKSTSDEQLCYFEFDIVQAISPELPQNSYEAPYIPNGTTPPLDAALSGDELTDQTPG